VHLAESEFRDQGAEMWRKAKLARHEIGLQGGEGSWYLRSIRRRQAFECIPGPARSTRGAGLRFMSGHRSSDLPSD
jgi:hypothetical protein